MSKLNSCGYKRSEKKGGKKTTTISNHPSDKKKGTRTRFEERELRPTTRKIYNSISKKAALFSIQAMCDLS